jgi:RHS repeat-associated protein
LNPVRTLAASVDASAPSPGFPLVFRRLYRQPILSRFKLGTLGRGWSHNWDVWIQTLTNLNGVVIHGPGGSDRFFGRFADGTYTSTGGDNGQLIVSSKLFRRVEADKTIWQFNSSNRLDYVQDPNGNRITCGYTGALLTSLLHSSGKTFLLEYDGSGRLIRLTDPLGPGSADDRVTTYEYDASAEHLTRVTAPGGRVTVYDYASSALAQTSHALAQVTYSDLTADTFSYDNQGRLAGSSKSCCGGAQNVAYGYDLSGTVTIRDAAGRTTQLLYGLGGQLAQVRDGEGRIVTFTYDDASDLTQIVGPSGERYRYAYDDLGNLTGMENPLRQVNNFTYETNYSRLAQLIDARGHGQQYGYDTRGNLTAITYADGTRELFAYDAHGNVITSTNRRGGVITYTYNVAGQLTSKDYDGTLGITDFTYAYDAAGNLTNATYWNPQSSTQETMRLQYDPFTDRLTRIDYPGRTFFTFAYDAVGHRTRRLDQDGHVTAYLHDNLGRLSRMTNELGQGIVTYDYDPAGRLSRKSLGNGVFTTYSYNNAGQMTLLVNSRADNSVLSSFAYTYDASGRRDSMTTLAGTETYGYDPLGQLTSVTYPNGRVVTYAYDPAGNRTQVTDNGRSTVYAVNPLNQYTTVGDETLHYDADGSLTNVLSNLNPQHSTNYFYDIENRLIGVATPSDNWTYIYNALGNRIETTHNGVITRYVIDPVGLGNVIGEYNGAGSLVARYEHGLGLLTRSDGANRTGYYSFSAIGHTSEVTDETGAVLNSYSYEPFGNPLAKHELISNPFQFVGEFGVMKDNEDITLMRIRSYSPSEGRFDQRDPVGVVSGISLYHYTANDPISSTDPSGLYSFYGNGPFDVNDIPSYMLSRELNGLEFQFDQWKQQTTQQIVKWYPTVIDLLCAVNDLTVELDKHPVGAATQIIIKAICDVWGVYHGVQEIKAIEAVPNKVLNWLLTLFGRFNDPNDLLGPGGYGPSKFIRPTIILPYQSQFENEANANAPTQEIIVTNVLDVNLDLGSLEVTEITFANRVISIPSGHNHYEASIPMNAGTNSLLVVVEAGVDFATRTLKLSLTPIDPKTGWPPEDPFVGLLYPEDGSGRGKGSISYFIKPGSGLMTGTVIYNQARVVFVHNDPIDTPRVFNTIDSGAPTSQVAALPANTTNNFVVKWSGQDDPRGSGIADYDIYVSIDGTNYTRWLDHTVSNSAVFGGPAGFTYSFYSIARDNVGNEEALKSKPDAQTTIQAGNQPPIAVDMSAQRLQDRSLKLLVEKLIGNDYDPDGDTIALASVSPTSANGAAVSIDSGWVIYEPPTGFNSADSFTYTISDGKGGTATATVHISVVPVNDNAASHNIVALLPQPDGSRLIRFIGIPERTYRIQATTDLDNPNWVPLTSVVAGSNGLFQFFDTDAPLYPQRYYRAIP